MSTRKAKASLVGPTVSTDPLLIPAKPIINTDVAVVQEDDFLEAMSADKLDQIGKELGMVALNATTMQAITKLGIVVEGMGLIQMTRGFAYLSSSSIVHCITELNSRIDPSKTVDELRAIAYPLGYLADKLAKTGKNAVEIGRATDAKPATGGPKVRRSFSPHAAVGVQFVEK